MFAGEGKKKVRGITTGENRVKMGFYGWERFVCSISQRQR